MKLIRDVLTGINGITYDNIRVGMMMALLTLIGVVITLLYQRQPVDMQAFGISAAAILGAGGFGIGQKAHTEPQTSTEPQPQA